MFRKAMFESSCQPLGHMTPLRWCAFIREDEIARIEGLYSATFVKWMSP